MNILIFNWRDTKNPKAGGAEIITMEHAVAWVKAGHDVTWFSSSFNGSKKKEIIRNVNIVRRGNALTVYLLAPFFYFFSGVKFDLVIDEIHGLPFFTPLYVKIPKIVLIHEVAGEIWDYMLPFPANIMGKFLEKFYFKLYKNTKFWIPSKSTEEDLLKQGIKASNIYPIICAIDDPVVSVPLKKEKIPTFIFVSRVVKMKGVEEVIKAFFFILKEIKDGQLWIIGDGDEKYINTLKKTMHDYSISAKVKFFGRINNTKKIDLMGRAHLLLHASIKEGWGLVVVEAASQSTPSVVYNVSGLRDSVLNGKTGVVTSKNNPEEMAKQAVALLNDKKRYRFFQMEGLRWARSLSWKTAVRQSLALIENVSNFK